MVEGAGIVILKKPEWGRPKVFVTLNRKEKSIDISYEDFITALKAGLKPQITKYRLDRAVDIAANKILSEMRESVVLPMEQIDE
jgi:hypothetical protein